jgi:hypothetical protein
MEEGSRERESLFLSARQNLIPGRFLIEALGEATQFGFLHVRRLTVEEPDHRRRRLLR